MPKVQRNAMAFLDYARWQCSAAGVRFDFEARSKTVDNCAGYFNHERRVLYVAALSEEWPSVLAHELGHLRQWVHATPAWEPESDSSTIDEWLGGMTISSRKLRRVVQGVQRCELDAERHALRLIRAFRLAENIGRFIQEANAYVWSFELVRRHVMPWHLARPYPSHLYTVLPSKMLRVRDISAIPEDIEAELLEANLNASSSTT